MACVNVPALPLQLLLRDRPEWRDGPVAVVDRDKPNGVIQWVNAPAQARRILPGMRYAAGLSICHTLRADVVPETRIEEEIADLRRRLWQFSPRVESASREPGVFWLDASGLSRIFPSLDGWAERIRAELRAAGFSATAAVGFTRFGTYAAAKAETKQLVFDTRRQEQTHMRAVPIERLGVDPGLRDMLCQLGITTVGQFMDLPPDQLHARFAEEAYRLHRLAWDAGWSPLQPELPSEPPERVSSLDYPETSQERLMGRIEPVLQSILLELGERYEALASIHLELKLDDGQKREESIAPASPVQEIGIPLQLIRLRLESLSLPAGVVELKVCGHGVRFSEHQLDLLDGISNAQLERARLALARIRADLGSGAVIRARLWEGHLPEACFEWEPFKELTSPQAAYAPMRPVVRRMYSPPTILSSRDRREPDGWLIAGLAEGPVEETCGPYILSGGWWRKPIERAYYYVRTRSGRWLWIYHDRRRRRWYLQGEVE